jgi:predicted alpha/beta-hydrolase family hydrolase
VVREIEIDTPRGSVSGAWEWPRGAGAVLVLAHGAGGDRRSALLAGLADGLAGFGIGTLRFNFAYSERGRRAPDQQPALRDVFSAAFDVAVRRARGAPVFVGGKSLGGRIASLLVADGLAAAGLVFVGYPLHAPGKPEKLRDEHLDRIRVPMLFLQGTADPFARWDLLTAVTNRLGRRATVHPIDGGDHSFRVRGRRVPDEEIGRDLAEPSASFIHRVAG